MKDFFIIVGLLIGALFISLTWGIITIFWVLVRTSPYWGSALIIIAAVKYFFF